MRDVGSRLLPVLVSTGSLLTFVAFAGSVIVWTRLNAVEVAPDQAITAFPRSELVSIGASLLLLYGFFGALAVLGALLIDRGGRPTQGMAYGLLFLLTAEGVVAIATAAEFGSRDWVAAMLLFLFPIAFAAWVLGLGPSRTTLFSELRDELPSRPTETRPPTRIWTALRPPPRYLEEGEGGDARRGFTTRGRQLVQLLVGMSIMSAAMGAVFAAIALLVQAQNLVLVVGLGIFAFFFVRATGVALLVNSIETRSQRETVRKEEEEETAWLAATEEVVAGLEDDDAQTMNSDTRRRIADLRLAGRRPYRLYLTWRGIAVVVPALLLAAVLPAWQLGELWLGAALAAAAVICMWLWRVSIFTRDKVIWFGLAVFLSVPLFGTFINMARNIDDPQIQPVALIRNTDRPDQAIHGLYVTEAESRVYFATVATEGCTGSLRENSGRLLWVPRDEVVAMSIGPLQSIQAAAKSSLEMAFALTPAVETPAGDSVSLTTGEVRSEEGGLGEEAPLTVQRLENVGAAVGPTFGRGLSLDPEDAAPGEIVTLRMNTPVKDGFGADRAGKTVRVGGVPAGIVRNPTLHAQRAEYVRTEDGRTLPLDKKGRYAEDEDEEMVTLDERPDLAEEPLYVRLDEDSGVIAPYRDDAENPGAYLRLEPDPERAPRPDADLPERLAARSITFRDGETVPVRRRLLRQAWNKDEIRFEVPDKGSTGVVTVDCEQLAGQPLLRVERPPEARISARLLGPGKIELDSRASRDEGGRVQARRWRVDGKPRFRGKSRKRQKRPKGEAVAVLGLPPGHAIHRVRLVVEDDQGETDAAGLYLVRLPGSGLDRDRVERVRELLLKHVRAEAPAQIGVDGHARDETGAEPAVKSSRAALGTIRRLLTPATARRAQLEGGSVAVLARAFGEGCAIVRGDSRHDHHVDVAVLTEGVELGPPKGCRPHEVELRDWTVREPTVVEKPTRKPVGWRATF